MSHWSAEGLHIGEGMDADSTAVIGYPPSREIPNTELIVGPGARIRSGTVIYRGSRIGRSFQTGHNVIIREENVIGDDVAVAGNSVVDYGCVIGNRVRIHTGVYVAQYTIIEDDVFLAPGVIIGNDPHPGCAFSKECMRGPIIRNGAQIGINVTLLPFIEIGAGAVIGAGSVVTRNIPPRMLAFGSPARVIRPVSDLTCSVEPKLTPGPYPSRAE